MSLKALKDSTTNVLPAANRVCWRLPPEWNSLVFDKFEKLEKHTREDGYRTYITPNGIKLPSITTVLQKWGDGVTAIAEWKKRIGTQEAEKIASYSRARGTRLHTAIEDYILGKDVDLRDHLTRSLFKQVKPILNNLYEVFVVEQELYSESLGVAGTTDLVASFIDEKTKKEVLAVFDWKTSGRLKTPDELVNYFLQCTAYALMFKEQTSIDINKFCICIATEDSNEPVIFWGNVDEYVDELNKAIANFGGA